MRRRCREIFYSFSEKEKLPKLSEEKVSPVVTTDDDDDVVITTMKELTLVRRIIISHLPL